MSLSFHYQKQKIPKGEGARLEAEEKATLGRFMMTADNDILTRGRSLFSKNLEYGPLLGNYYAAQWLAWNYWRLRWEGRATQKQDKLAWKMAHSMRSIGHGYVWPDISFISDGERVILSSKIANMENTGAFKYTGAMPHLIHAKDFDMALGKYAKQVLTDLESEGLKNTEFHILWQDLQEERTMPALAEKRRFEALLGYDPDEGDEEQLEILSEMAKRLDDKIAEEFAAQYGWKQPFLTFAQLDSAAIRDGIAGNWGDAVSFSGGVELPKIGNVEAWRLGREAANKLRRQEALGRDVIESKKLTELAGVEQDAVASKPHAPDFSFTLEEGEGKQSFFMLHGKRPTSRRFALARLLADKLIYKNSDKARLAGDADTYRQKMQRAFAAELLCPIESLKDYLENDYSDRERFEDAANHFQVSPLTIEASLANQGLIDRNGVLDPDIEATGTKVANDNYETTSKAESL